MPPLIAATSSAATGMANASETALHRSTSGCSRGSVPSLRNRRSSDSAAHRYWVGLSPIRANARRHAWISGSSLSGPSASRASAMARNFSVWPAEPAGTGRPIPVT